MQDKDKKKFVNREISDRFAEDIKHVWTRSLELMDTILLVASVPGNTPEARAEKKDEIRNEFRKSLLRAGNDKIRNFSDVFINNFRIYKIDKKYKDVVRPPNRNRKINHINGNK